MRKNGTGIENRRRFLIVGSAAVVAPFVPGVSSAQHEAHASDRVQQELQRQLRLHTQRLYKNARAEDARALAATLRLAAAHGKGKQIDAEVQRRLRQAIARQGRSAILLQLDSIPSAMQAEARALGVEIPSLVPGSLSDRDAALDHLLRHGVTVQWEQAAALLESAAEKMDAQPMHRVRFQSRATDTDMCGTFRLAEARLGYAARLSCGVVWLGPLAADLCAAAFGAWAGAWAATCVYCGC